MDEPWFHRFGGFFYWPISWQGVALLAIQLGVCIPLGLVSLRYADSSPILGWGAGLASVCAYWALYAVIVWKSDLSYRS